MRPEDKLECYHQLLLQWQKTINLVSLTTLDNAWERHFEDSKQLHNHIPKETKSICDIGSGAGFPGLVLAILNPDIQVSLVESDTRKCAFLRTVSRETQCENVTIYNDRIENVMVDIKADLITARALASLRSLIDYSYPYCENMLLLKGKNWCDEIAEAQKRYDFDLHDYPSKTDDAARILIVNNIGLK
jgi:16S rRNA (guanine527-N7)-methyltransferase